LPSGELFTHLFRMKTFDARVVLIAVVVVVADDDDVVALGVG